MHDSQKIEAWIAQQFAYHAAVREAFDTGTLWAIQVVDDFESDEFWPPGLAAL